MGGSNRWQRYANIAALAKIADQFGGELQFRRRNLCQPVHQRGKMLIDEVNFELRTCHEKLHPVVPQTGATDARKISRCPLSPDRFRAEKYSRRRRNSSRIPTQADA